MKRRIFIKNTSSAIMGTALTPELFSASWAPENVSDQKLKGFIVSDAHFGWKNDQQPEPEIQQEMMDRIMKRFPDLDVFLDVGDAHHSGLRGESGDIARGGFRPENNIWEWQDPGVRLLPQESPDKTVNVSIPGHNQGNSHFRCSPHHTYQATLQLESPEGGQQLQLRIVFQTNEGRELASVEMPAEKIKPGLNTFEAKAALPAEAVSETIYTDPSRNQLIQVMVVATFSQLTSGLTLKKYRLLAEDASIDTLNPEIIIGEKRFPHTGRVPEGKILRYDIELPSAERNVYSCKVEGTQRVTWLVRRPMIQWQVRNATVADKGDYLEVGPLRDTWTHRKEAIISPMEQGSTRFVHRLKNTNKVRIFPLTPKNKEELKIEVLECGEQAEISVYSKQAPSRVTGTNSWKYQAPVLSINVKSGDRILIQ